MKLRLLLAVLYSTVNLGWSWCGCGRGGICLDQGSRRHKWTMATPCHCDKVSKGLFISRTVNCNQIIKGFCKNKPCAHGDCISGFGTFFCNCGSPLFGAKEGRLCDRKRVSSHGLMVGLWYPITGERGWNVFLFGYKFPPETSLSFEFEDGRVASFESCKSASNYEVLKRCTKNGEFADCDVAFQLLHQTKVTIKCSVIVPFSPERELKVTGLAGPAGQYHDVWIRYADNDIVHFYEKYRVYVDSGPLNKLCPYRVKITGCGATPKLAEHVMSSSSILLSAKATFYDPSHNNCPVKSTAYQWSFSPLVRRSGKSTHVGNGSLLEVVPATYGFVSGPVAIQVDITFQKLVDLPDESVTSFCYIDITRSTIYIWISDNELIYSCGVVTQVFIQPVITGSNYDMANLKYSWQCSENLCRDAHRHQKDLVFRVNAPCGRRYRIEFQVREPGSSTIYPWSGHLVFELPYEYNIKFTCEPDCIHVNPAIPLTLKAVETPDVSSTFKWTITPSININSDCENYLPSNVLIIPSNILAPQTTYFFNISTLRGSKVFSVITLEPPANLTCSIERTDSGLENRYMFDCKIIAEHLPLEFWVYEGPHRDLLKISNSPSILLDISYSPVEVEAVDWLGMKSTPYIVKVNVTMETDPNKVKAVIDSLITIDMSSDDTEMVERIDDITKINMSYPFAWKSKLMYYLSRIRTCSTVESAIKISNSIRRLASGKVLNETQGVDEFIIQAGATLYNVAKSLRQIVTKVRQKFAFFLLPAVTSLHAAIQITIGFEDPVLFYPNIDEDIRRIHYRKTQKGNDFARWAISEIGLFIASFTPHPSLPITLKSETEAMSMTIVPNNVYFINCVAALHKVHSYIQFSNESNVRLRSVRHPVCVAVAHYNITNFWWSQMDKSNAGEMIDVYVFAKEENTEWKQMVNAGGVRSFLITRHIATKTVQGENRSNVHKIVVPPGKTALVLDFPKELVGAIRIYVNTSLLTSDENTTEVLKLKNIVYHHESDVLGNIYVGINASSHFAYSFNMTVVQCLTRAQGKWTGNACRFYGYIANTAVCHCEHLSLLSVVSYFPKEVIVPVLKFKLYTTVNNYWYAFAVLVGIVVVSLLLLSISHVMEQVNEKKRAVIFLEDNWPGDGIPYLVTVFTAGRCMSGTTSHVALRIIGTESISRVHVLSPKSHEPTLAWGQDSWFILFTATELGTCKKIELWLDNSGLNPDWYCIEIMVWDLYSGIRYRFPVHMWLNHCNLFVMQESSFMFDWNPRGRERTWRSFIISYVHTYIRQEHHWASVCLRHPRSLYTKVEVTLICVVMVSVAVVATMTSHIDPGPADIPVIKITKRDVSTGFTSLLIMLIISLTIAGLLAFGKKRTLDDIAFKCGYLPNFTHPNNFIFRYLIRPAGHMPVMTQETYKTMDRLRNCWTLTALGASFIVIVSCFTYILIVGWSIGKNRTCIWVVVSIIVIVTEAIVVNPGLILITASIAAYLMKKSSRDVIIIYLEPWRDSLPYEDADKRFVYMINTRVKSMYKPPLRQIVRKRATEAARTNVFDLFRITNNVILFVVILVLIRLLDIQGECKINRNLSELFTRSKSSVVPDLATIRNRTKFFDYIRGTLLSSLHRMNWYNGRPLPIERNEPIDFFNATRPSTKYRGYCADYASKLVGVPQLRQQRISPFFQIKVAPEFVDLFPVAYGYLSTLNEDTKPYLPSWEKPVKGKRYDRIWKYTSTDRLDTMELMGVSQQHYSGGGYIQNLHWSKGLSEIIVVDLELDGWLDNATRAIFFTFNLYNMYERKLAYVIIVTERLPSGVFRSRAKTESALVTSERSQHEVTIAGLIFVIAIVVTTHAFRVATLISMRGWKEFVNSVSGLTDIALIVTGYGVILSFLARFATFFEAFEDVESAARDKYTPLYSRFYKNTIFFVFISAFAAAVTAFGTILVHNLLGFETTYRILARTRALILIFAIISSFVAYLSLNFMQFSSREVPNLYYMYVFKEAALLDETVSFARVTYLMMALVFLVMLSKLNLAVLVHLYANKAALIETKMSSVKGTISTMTGRVEPVRTLQRKVKWKAGARKPRRRSWTPNLASRVAFSAGSMEKTP